MSSYKEVFESYTKGKEFMFSREFIKVLKDSEILKKITQTRADLEFTKLGKTAKRITLEQFEELLQKLPNEKITYDEIKEKVLNLKGPIFVGTKTDDVRFYDDKSSYTGVHKHGGPSTVDVSSVARSGGAVQGGDKPTMDSLMNRGAYDIRGVPIKEADATKKKTFL